MVFIEELQKWKKRKYPDGSVRFTHHNKFIDVHKSMGNYWIDYGMKDGNILATTLPTKTMKDALKRVREVAEKDFVWKEKK